MIDTHKSIGITVLGLAMLRILWRVSHRPPAFPSAYARWEQLGSRTAHGLLYLVMLMLPLSGWLHDSAWKDAATHPMLLFGGFEWPRIACVMSLGPETRESLHSLFGDVHTALAYCLYALLALHVLGALKHQWIDCAAEMQRMSL